MEMKSVGFIIFSALLCMFMIPQSASAEVNNMPSNFYELKSQEGKDIYFFNRKSLNYSGKYHASNV